jgi:hypothetical protein
VGLATWRWGGRMNVAGDSGGAKLAKRRPPIRGAQGSQSAPCPERHPEHEALTDEAIALFGRRYARTVGREEARQMIERLTAFFDLLAEWELCAQREPVEGKVAA